MPGRLLLCAALTLGVAAPSQAEMRYEDCLRAMISVFDARDRAREDVRTLRRDLEAVPGFDEATSDALWEIVGQYIAMTKTLQDHCDALRDAREKRINSSLPQTPAQAE